jgi:hypothetical protein
VLCGFHYSTISKAANPIFLDRILSHNTRHSTVAESSQTSQGFEKMTETSDDIRDNPKTKSLPYSGMKRTAE